MTSKPTIAVFGATGKQGGSVISSLLLTAHFSIRGITRNVSSPRALALAAQGVAMVQANGFDTAAMISALQGAWGLFVNTNTDDPELQDGKLEVQLGKGVMDAARAAGVSCVVYSTLPSAVGLSGGRIRVDCFDSKFEIQEYARGLGFATTAFVEAGWYMENFESSMGGLFGGFPDNVDVDGYLTLKYLFLGEEEGIPLISIKDDFGDIVQGLFLAPERFNGRIVHGVGQLLTFEEMAARFTEVTGRKARYVPTDIKSYPRDSYFMDELIKTWELTQSLGGRTYGLATDLVVAKELKGIVRGSAADEMMNWREWAKRTFVK